MAEVNVSSSFEDGNLVFRDKTNTVICTLNGATGALNLASGSVAGAVAAGYKIARGMHTTVSATDTVVTGLTTVVAAFASMETDPADAQYLATAAIGDQAGAPAAGSIVIKSWAGASASDYTPTAAGSFTKLVSWFAIGT